jgi:phosphoribosylamine--glycine ligase
VVEFNARFGDPETQALMALLRSSLFRLLHAAATGRLDQVEAPRWHAGAAVTVVMAAEGYPGTPRKGDPITGVADAAGLDGVEVTQAGTALADGVLVTAGGRVLAVTAVGEDLMAARQQAYRGVTAIAFGGAQHRTDIAADAAVAATDLSR